MNIRGLQTNENKNVAQIELFQHNKNLQIQDKQSVRPPRPSSISDNKENKNQSITKQERPKSRERIQVEDKKITQYQQSKKDSVSTDISVQKSIRPKSKENHRSNSLTKKDDNQHDHGKKKKTKIQKIYAQQQEHIKKLIQQDEEEKQRIEDEERRSIELEKFRLEQEQKLTAEEKLRLSKEKSDEETFLIQFESTIYSIERQKKEKEIWEKYKNCEMKIDPNEEKQLTAFIYMFNEQNDVNNMDINLNLQKSDYAENVISDLFSAYYKAQADNKYEIMNYYLKFVKNIRQISINKIDECTAFIMKNCQILIDNHNLTLDKLQKPILKRENINLITNLITQKQDERYKYEFIQTFQSKHIKVSHWFNPISKCGFRHKPVEFPDLQLFCEIPKHIMTYPIVMRALWTSFDYLSIKGQFIPYDCLGGVFQFDCYEFVPLPRISRKWALQRDFTDKQEILKKYSFTPDNYQSKVNQALPSIKVTITLPKQCFISPKDEIKIGYFNQKSGWQFDQIEQTQFVFESKRCSFNSNILSPFAFFQKRCTDFPYKSWSIRQIAEEVALLQLETKRISLSFEIGLNYVKLLPNQIQQVQHLVNQQYEATFLLNELSKIGINLMPENLDFVQAEIPQKEIDVENKALQEIIVALLAFSIKSSKWNSQSQEDKIIFQIRENVDYMNYCEENDLYNWKTMAIYCNKCAYIQANENDQKLNLNLAQKSQTHVMLSLLFKSHNVVQLDCIERMSSLNYMDFQNNVRRFLKMLRVISFS